MPDIPMITGLAHLAIRTNDLAASLAFYGGLLGLRQSQRPVTGYSGAWLSVQLSGKPTILHLYAGGPEMGAAGRAPLGAGAIDHLALSASGFHAYRERFRAAGLPWREHLTPASQIWSLFTYDPSGVLVELLFDGRGEPGAPPDPALAYQPGRSFFDAPRYPRLAAQPG
ncbi:VOC family protein [Roseomonas marmotae]|uniref:VOC family protein n=1 Tax=Roseomonas marmotae TaxID=2768161 RepID=UPI001AD64CB7|nr:VOC family protein [Roseomonas marmotae]